MFQKRVKKAAQKGGSSRSNRLHLLPADTVEHALRGALFQYAQVTELATHARYLHALQRTRGFALQAQLQRQNLFSIKFQSVFAPLSFQLVDYQ